VYKGTKLVWVFPEVKPAKGHALAAWRACTGARHVYCFCFATAFSGLHHRALSCYHLAEALVQSEHVVLAGGGGARALVAVVR
jgi:hypothetical protein